MSSLLPTQPGQLYTPGGLLHNVRPGFASKTAKILGIIQVILGCCSILFQIIALVIGDHMSTLGTGIWCGVFFCIAGAFGISAGVKKTNCFIITYLILSIIAAVLAGILCICSSVAVLIASSFGDHYHYYYSSGSRIGVSACLLIHGMLEMFVAIWASAVCCKATCCLPGLESTMPYHVQYVPTAGPQPIVLLGPPNTQSGLMYAIPQGQMAAPYIIQQGMPVPAAPPSEQQAEEASPPPLYTEGAAQSNTDSQFLGQPLLNAKE